MTDQPTYPYVHLDVTAAQAGRPAIALERDPTVNRRLTAAEALALGDDLRRAAMTARQLHHEFGDDRDPQHTVPTSGPTAEPEF